MEPNIADIGILVNKYSGNIHDIKEYYRSMMSALSTNCVV